MHFCVPLCCFLTVFLCKQHALDWHLWPLCHILHISASLLKTLCRVLRTGVCERPLTHHTRSHRTEPVMVAGCLHFTSKAASLDKPFPSRKQLSSWDYRCSFGQKLFWSDTKQIGMRLWFPDRGCYIQLAGSGLSKRSRIQHQGFWSR